MPPAVPEAIFTKLPYPNPPFPDSARSTHYVLQSREISTSTKVGLGFCVILLIAIVILCMSWKFTPQRIGMNLFCCCMRKVDDRYGVKGKTVQFAKKGMGKAGADTEAVWAKVGYLEKNPKTGKIIGGAKLGVKGAKLAGIPLPDVQVPKQAKMARNYSRVW